MNQNLHSLQPTRVADFTPDGEKSQKAYALTMGEFALIGVQPEINAITGQEITAALPDNNVAVAIMVNGGEKCMPEKEAYELVKYQCLNSPFMPGAAELLRDTAVHIVQQLEGIATYNFAGK